MRATGGLLIYALMILPASAAFQWVYDIKKVFLPAPALAIAFALGGLRAFTWFGSSFEIGHGA